MEQQQEKTQQLFNNNTTESTSNKFNFSGSINAYLTKSYSNDANKNEPENFIGAVHIKLVPTQNTLDNLIKITNNDMCFNTIHNNAKFSIDNQELIKLLFTTYDNKFTNNSCDIINNNTYPPLKTLHLL